MEEDQKKTKFFSSSRSWGRQNNSCGQKKEISFFFIGEVCHNKKLENFFTVETFATIPFKAPPYETNNQQDLKTEFFEKFIGEK